ICGRRWVQSTHERQNTRRLARAAESPARMLRPTEYSSEKPGAEAGLLALCRVVQQNMQAAYTTPVVASRPSAIRAYFMSILRSATDYTGSPLVHPDIVDRSGAKFNNSEYRTVCRQATRRLPSASFAARQRLEWIDHGCVHWREMALVA